MAYNIYSDEAGTAPAEPVRVVSAILVDIDEKWRAAEAALLAAHNRIPEKYRPGFVFHAKSIWGDKAFRDGWAQDERRQLILDVMSIPRQLDMPVVLSAFRNVETKNADLQAAGLSQSDVHHMMAFGNCMTLVDRFLREHCDKPSLATLVAEDVGSKKRILKATVDVLRGMDIRFLDPGLRLGPQTKALTQVMDRVHFVEKPDAPLLQLADAAAFAFRRFISDQSYGGDFINHVAGYEVDRAKFDRVASAILLHRRQDRKHQKMIFSNDLM